MKELSRETKRIKKILKRARDKHKLKLKEKLEPELQSLSLYE